MSEKTGNTNLWSLKPANLAARCGAIAAGQVKAATESQRVEAAQLAREWQEVLETEVHGLEGPENKAGRIDALQKRTIQILVSLGEAG